MNVSPPSRTFDGLALVCTREGRIDRIARGGFARSTLLRIGSRDVQCFGFCDRDELRIVGVIDPLAAAPFPLPLNTELS
jgi:hypothetical protein